MIDLFFVLMLGLLAGLLVNVIVEFAPAFRSGGSHATIGAGSSILAARSGWWHGVTDRSPNTLACLIGASVIGLVAFWQISNPMAALRLAAWGWFLLAIAIIDLEHKLVLNKMLLVSLPLLLVSNLLSGQPGVLASIQGAGLAFAVFLLIALAQPKGMGMGDVKLAAWIGAAVGFPAVIQALVAGILFGGVAAGVILLIDRQRGRKMAYAPYLAMGAWLVMLGTYSA